MKELVDKSMNDFMDYCSKLSIIQLEKLYNDLNEYETDLLCSLAGIGNISSCLTNYLVNTPSRIDDAGEKAQYVSKLIKNLQQKEFMMGSL